MKVHEDGKKNKKLRDTAAGSDCAKCGLQNCDEVAHAIDDSSHPAEDENGGQRAETNTLADPTADCTHRVEAARALQ